MYTFSKPSTSPIYKNSYINFVSPCCNFSPIRFESNCNLNQFSSRFTRLYHRAIINDFNPRDPVCPGNLFVFAVGIEIT